MYVCIYIYIYVLRNILYSSYNTAIYCYMIYLHNSNQGSFTFALFQSVPFKMVLSESEMGHVSSQTNYNSWQLTGENLRDFDVGVTSQRNPKMGAMFLDINKLLVSSFFNEFSRCEIVKFFVWFNANIVGKPSWNPSKSEDRWRLRHLAVKDFGSQSEFCNHVIFDSQIELGSCNIVILASEFRVGRVWNM